EIPSRRWESAPRERPRRTSCGSIRRGPMRSCSSARPRRRPREASGPPWASSTPFRRGNARRARRRYGPRRGDADPAAEASAALRRRHRRLARLAQLRGVAAQAGRDPVTARLRVAAELRHVGLAGCLRSLELLVGLVDPGLALRRDLIGVLLEAGMHACATLGVGTEAGHGGRAPALAGGGGAPTPRA